MLHINAHQSFASTSALPAISRSQTAVWPLPAAQCRAVYCPLEQKIGSKHQKQNTTQNQWKIQNIYAHRFLASTSALPAISSSQTSVWPLPAAQCRAARWTLEQKIRSEFKKHNTIQNQQQILNINAHQFFASTSALPAINSSHTAVWPLRAASCRAVHWSLERKIRSKLQNQNTTLNR